jgi:hypothetical protein
LRKVEEEKRLKAEKDAGELKAKMEAEYQEKLKKELEERKRKEDSQIKCVHCKDIVKENEVILLETCLHAFHKKCLKETVIKAFEEKKVPIVCCNCKTELLVPEIKACLTGRQYKQYEDLTFRMFLEQNDEDYNSCPTATCKYMFELEDGIIDYDCPVCKRSYCLNCRMNAHQGWDCNRMGGFRFGVVKGQKLKACPICAFWVERPQGSSTMRCRCGNNFCYKCGKLGANCGCEA